MNKRQMFDYALTVLLFALATFITIGILVWVWPRDVIDLEIQTKLDTVSKASGRIETINTFTTYGNADSRYEQRLVCFNGAETSYFIQTIEANSTKSEERTSEAKFLIPELAQPDHTCRIEVDSQHKVEILPLLTKTLTDSFVSNDFRLVE